MPVVDSLFVFKASSFSRQFLGTRRGTIYRALFARSPRVLAADRVAGQNRSLWGPTSESALFDCNLINYLRIKALVAAAF